MKKTLVAIILAIVAFSCDNDNETTPDDFIYAEKNGVAWEGRTEMTFDQNNNGDTLIILGIGTEETLVMKIKFTGAGHYSLQEQQGVYYTTIGGDVLTSIYQTDDGNYIGGVKITRYDKDEKIIEGNFGVVLKQIRSNPENGIPAVTFIGGRFKGKIRP